MTFGKRGLLATLALAILVPVGACSVDRHDHIPAAALSIELAPADVAEHEQRLAEHPDDLVARTKLISHYSGARYVDYGSKRAQEAWDAHARHLVWMIRHAPDAHVRTRGAVAPRSEILNPEGYVAVEAAWQSQLDRQPSNTAIMDRFAAFLLVDDRERAIALLRTAQELEPTNPHWAERLGAAHLLKTISRDWESRYPSAPKDALRQLDRAYELHGAGDAPVFLQILRVNAAFKAERYALASTYARAMLLRFEADDSNPHGELVHHGHTILGRIALAQGHVEQAKEHLLASGRAPAQSFGPTMFLALELLERDEFDVVAEYLELCSDFWEDDDLDGWRTTVATGKVPDFGTKIGLGF